MSAFKKVGGMKKYVRYADCKPGQVVVEGKFLRKVANQFQSHNYEFLPKEGAVISLNSAGHLNYLMDEYVVIGDTVQVTYLGKEKLQKGAMKGKDAHKFEMAMLEKTEKDQKNQGELDLKEEGPESLGETPLKVDLSDLD